MTRDTVTSSYDGRAVELIDIPNQQYEDPDGNIYEMSLILEDETE
ncbi:hypothetical protein [Alkalibacterium sp. 20]|nr:hypothetical protein [Alkalibacterium sp. 20]